MMGLRRDVFFFFFFAAFDADLRGFVGALRVDFMRRS
jgi:hypothetical protein